MAAVISHEAAVYASVKLMYCIKLKLDLRGAV